MTCDNCGMNNFYEDECSGDFICKECGLISNDVMLKSDYNTFEQSEIFYTEIESRILKNIQIINEDLNVTMDVEVILKRVEELNLMDTQKLTTNRLLAIIAIDIKSANPSFDIEQLCERYRASPKMVYKYFNMYNHETKTTNYHKKENITITRLLKKVNDIGSFLGLAKEDLRIARITVYKLENVIRSHEAVVISMLIHLSRKKKINMLADIRKLSKTFNISMLTLKKAYVDVERLLTVNDKDM